jgi:hypothetical protein
MREQRTYISCAVATGNGFAMPYRARPVSQSEEKVSSKDCVTPIVTQSHAAKLAAERRSEKS